MRFLRLLYTDSESGDGQSDNGSWTASDHGPDTQGAEVSITDSDMPSQASTTEPNYPCDLNQR
jgi:hypothetical protein